MSLLIDKRDGSGEYYDYLTQHLHLPCELTSMAFGDFAFLGRGPEDCPVPVGIERKSLRDFITSCRSERLQGHQLPGLFKCYPRVWLVVEGTYKVGHSGEVLLPAGYENGKPKWKPMGLGGPPVTYDELYGRVLTLREKAPLQVEWTSGFAGKHGTGEFLKRLYRWWVTQGWDAHQSHLGFDSVDQVGSQFVKWNRGNPAHLVRLMAKELKGVGWQKAGNVAGQFPNVHAMVSATQKGWESIPGIGKTLAERIWKVLHGTDPDASEATAGQAGHAQGLGGEVEGGGPGAE